MPGLFIHFHQSSLFEVMSTFHVKLGYEPLAFGLVTELTPPSCDHSQACFSNEMW